MKTCMYERRDRLMLAYNLFTENKVFDKLQGILASFFRGFHRVSDARKITRLSYVLYKTKTYIYASKLKREFIN